MPSDIILFAYKPRSIPQHVSDTGTCLSKEYGLPPTDLCPCIFSRRRMGKWKVYLRGENDLLKGKADYSLWYDMQE